ncbi:MFS transporter [Staphylococcus saprophyticus]|uniref:MFS transporter n=1 Tax=Staphylococcus saprophyticus TaxID=29385 RepID=UPI000853DAF3|nr:MFS transporter [Staphylococcus saprophyticus]MDW4366109.1 MFS transporter [Staphylococcus saprophyticus]OEK97721.1 alpha-ketoglutarate permease [Staphylococcus saprophyticus]
MNHSNSILGMPRQIVWGYIGIIIFMMGDGLEIGWLSPWLHGHGFSVQETSLLFSAYGVTVALASWLSGVFAEALGGKRTMMLGLTFYIIGTIFFVGFAIPSQNLALMLPAYALRGLGYPLFAYSFLVWISYRSEQKTLGAAVGWFWFVFTGGLNVLGALYSIWAIEYLGHINTLWSSLFWVVLGGFFTLVLNKDKLPSNQGSSKEKLKEILKGITIMKDEPKVLLGGIVRVINTTAQFAFPVFLPIYLSSFGIPTSKWLAVWSTIFVGNIIFNLIFGIVGDKIGWRNTVMYFGGIGSSISVLLMGYVPIWTDGNIVLLTVVGFCWGAFIAAYVPLSALIPSLVKQDKGAALSVLNLGAGLPVFVGPMIVYLFIGSIQAIGVIWVLAILYFISTILTYFIKMPKHMQSGEHETA